MSMFKKLFIALLSLFGAYPVIADSFDDLDIAADAIWVDVRSQKEFNSGHVAQALNIPHNDIGNRLHEISADKNKAIYLYCQSGRRAAMAKETLIKAGYTNVHNIGGYEQASALLDKQSE